MLLSCPPLISLNHGTVNLVRYSSISSGPERVASWSRQNQALDSDGWRIRHVTPMGLPRPGITCSLIRGGGTTAGVAPAHRPNVPTSGIEKNIGRSCEEAYCPPKRRVGGLRARALPSLCSEFPRRRNLGCGSNPDGLISSQFPTVPVTSERIQCAYKHSIQHCVLVDLDVQVAVSATETRERVPVIKIIRHSAARNGLEAT